MLQAARNAYQTARGAQVLNIATRAARGGAARPLIAARALYYGAKTEQERAQNQRRVLVQNVPSEATETQIRDHFSAAGEVKDVIILTKVSGDRYSEMVVEFASRAAALMSRQLLNDRVFFGRKIRVLEDNYTEAKLRSLTETTVALYNLPFEADEEDVRDLGEMFGEVLGVHTQRRSFLKNVSLSFIHFKARQDAVKAKQVINGKEIDGRSITAVMAGDDIPEPTNEEPTARTYNTVNYTSFPWLAEYTSERLKRAHLYDLKLSKGD
mmetsp:Transcript_6880/g.20928  ORF Transcript_6880/g.20928 Transcript_6880/m.20928 type:complete len:268 (+) Transcript_6880:154-957(+)